MRRDGVAGAQVHHTWPRGGDGRHHVERGVLAGSAVHTRIGVGTCLAVVSAKRRR